MILTSKKDVMDAIKNGDLKPGTIYHKTNGVFMLTDLDGNDSGIIGHAAECEITDDGDITPMEKPSHVTAVDLKGAEL